MDSTQSSQELTPCQKQIKEAVADLRKTLERASCLPPTVSDQEREGADQDIALSSRSAYFDFYTWVILNDSIDESAEAPWPSPICLNRHATR